MQKKVEGSPVGGGVDVNKVIVKKSGGMRCGAPIRGWELVEVGRSHIGGSG